MSEQSVVSLPFGRAVEEYIYKHDLLKNIRLKKQSRTKVNKAINTGLVTLQRVEGAIDFIGWTTVKNEDKSTNRLDDTLRLTDAGRARVNQVKQGVARDMCVWYWVLFCAGDGNCQRACGGYGKCMEECPNYGLKNNIKNDFDMHKCTIRILIKGQHIPENIAVNHQPSISRINLSHKTRDLILSSRRGASSSKMGVMMKMLVQYNEASVNTIKEELKSQKNICTEQKLQGLLGQDGAWTMLHKLIVKQLKDKGAVLYYQQPDINIETPADNPDHYYQLTLSDELWLCQARDHGYFCIGIDGMGNTT
ncbi:11757_t:CDS:2 [Paraglomus brasilianum]|uniref:11757_t:CDS:1 n=1 Tax=Paraglomus brasilianum TaxID=144538 RepID=A0A9N9H0C3_9GLOM|nr:11757_t:CDS:2 [Paraglomus brasilianum]